MSMVLMSSDEEIRKQVLIEKAKLKDKMNNAQTVGELARACRGYKVYCEMWHRFLI